jgi:hypothetical protein
MRLKACGKLPSNSRVAGRTSSDSRSGRHDLADIAQDYAGFAHLQKPFYVLEWVELPE